MSIRRAKRRATIATRPQSETWKFWIFVAGISLLFLIVLIRLFQVQILAHSEYKAKADNKHQARVDLIGDRGNIYFQNLKSGDNFPVAINLITYDIGFDANFISQTNKSNQAQIKEFIDQNFPDIDKVKLEEEFNNKDKRYYIFAKDVPESIVEPLKKKALKGIILEKKSVRNYPEKTLGSHILGYFSKYKQKGQYGLEQYYNEQLKGEVGFANVEAKDGRGVWLANTKIEKQDATNGSSLILTVDHTIQFKLEETLAELSAEFKPKTALGAIMDPKTGDILAMAATPNFDINEYNKVDDIGVFKNPLVENLYEQGSIFKPITVGIGLDKGVITPSTTYEDKGTERINGFDISNWSQKVYGTQTMSYALENSLNLGMIFIQRKLGREAFVSGIIDQFQISKETGVDLPGEVKSNTNNLTKQARDLREVDFANASYGQGISMTPIRMLTSFNSIVNEGKIMKPRIVKSIQNSEGEITNIEPEVQGQSMSPEKARQLSEMLVDVVKNSSAKQVMVDGYNIGGKTGTGQIASVGGFQKEGGETHQSFIQFATLDNPKYTLLISLNAPQGSRFADTSVVPKIKPLNEFLLSYLNVPQDK
jgi:stage V sporulation protein D (sporulation-specific penicillin-binding protein)